MPKLSAFISSSFSKKVNLINKLTIDLYTCLPPAFYGHCHIVNLQDDTMFISSDSSIWANKLRFYKTEIIKHFYLKRKLNLKNIKFIIAPNQHPQSHKMHKNLYISRHSAQKLKSLANTVKHAPLRQALLKLSQHTKNQE